MSDSRMSHRHHSQAPHGYPQSAYPPSNYHPSARHISNGPPPPGMMAAPPSMSMGGPPEPQPIMTNGHGQGHPPQHMSSAARAGKEKMDTLLSNLASANENTWMLIGAVAEQVQDQEKALKAFETALKHNPSSILALNAVASIARSRDDFDKAIEYFQRILNLKQDNGEVWGSMGHCLLMKDDLPKAYTAYQQALYYLPNPKEPKLWYGIGILYDRYGSFEHAEEAFSSVLKMDPQFEKANEIYFRLGIIYKHQRKYNASLDCFRWILENPPRPLTTWDIWFQLGHVYEQDRDYEQARDAYSRVLEHQPDHAKVLQQLGWLYHQPGAPFADQEKAVTYLTKSLETDGNDAQSWYLLGRAYMAGQRYNKAYEAYQQAVYRDGRNPTFWCSIGVLYYQINQYRDALDAYSRAIRLNPYISEVWFNLGSLYESCNNQITDAIDAYSRAADLDPTNASIKQRHAMLQSGQSAQSLPPPPQPVDVHPSQYTAQPPTQHAAGSPGHSPGRGPMDGRMDGPPPSGVRDLPPPPPGGDFARGHSPGAFRGGAAPPPLQHVDESRGSMSRHAPLAPIEVGRVDPRDSREMPPVNGYRDVQDRRHPEGPGSPRRRNDYPGQYPQYPGHGRDRERGGGEWERIDRTRGPGGPGPDPRGPSPRLPEYRHGAQHMPSRGPADPRDYHRYGESSQPQMDRMYHNDPRYDPRREERMEPIRGPSLAREDTRAHSPAPSAASRASTKRKQKEEESRTAAKKVKDDGKAPSKKSSTNGNGEKKGFKAPPQRPGEDLPSPRPTVASSPANSAVEPLVPTRTIDEDYDDGAGAADALMSLHGDRPSGTESGSQSPVAPTAGSKRAISPRSDAVQSIKRAKSGSGSDSPAKHTVIEVLNTPNADSPLPKMDSVKNGEGYFKGSEPAAPPAQPVEEAEKKAAEPVEVEAPANVEMTEQRVATPPLPADAAPEPDAAAKAEDVTMAEPEPAVVPAAPVPEVTPPAVEDKAPEATPMEVDPVKEVVPESAAAPAPAEEAGAAVSEAVEPAAQAEEKKDE